MEVFTLINRYANGMEFIQVMAAFAGIVFSLWALMDATRDSMALASAGSNGPRSVIAKGNIYTEFERLIVHFLLFIVGLCSIFLPPPFGIGQSVDSPELLQHTITRSVLIAITVLKVIGAIRARWERNQFVRKMSASGRNPHTPPCALAPPPTIPANGKYDDDDPSTERREPDKGAA
jgi:hypothetical protein